MNYSPPPGRPQSCPPMTFGLPVDPPTASNKPVRMPGESKWAYGGRVSAWSQKQDLEKYRATRSIASALGHKRKREREHRRALIEAGKAAVPSKTHRWYSYTDLRNILGWSLSHTEVLVKDWPRRRLHGEHKNGRPRIELFGDITTLPMKTGWKDPTPAPVGEVPQFVAWVNSATPIVSVAPPPRPFWKRLLGWFA